MESLDHSHADALSVQEMSAQARENPDKVISELRNRIAILENTLRQRQEEIEQTRSALKSEQNKSQKIEILNFKIKDADNWIFRLAGERQATERLLVRQGRRLKEAERRVTEQKNRGRELEDKLSQERYRLKELLLNLSLKEEISKNLEIKLNISELENKKIRLDFEEKERCIEKAKVDMSRVVSDLKSTRLDVEKRFHELAILTKLLKVSEDKEEVLSHQNDWLLRICSFLDYRPWWWAFAPRKWKMRYRQDRLRRMNLFDVQRYVELYPDVAAEGVDPVRHYITHGMKEGRICPQ